MSCLRSAGMIHSADSYVRAPCIHRTAFITLHVRTYNIYSTFHTVCVSARFGSRPQEHRDGKREEGKRDRAWRRARATMRLRYKLPAGNELCPCTAHRDVSSAVSRSTEPYVEPLRMLLRRNGSRAAVPYLPGH